VFDPYTPAHYTPRKLTNLEKSKLHKLRWADENRGKYHPEYDNKVLELAKSKTTIDFRNEICSMLNVSHVTLKNWMKRYPSFAEAYEIAKIKWKSRLDQELIKNQGINYAAYKTAYYQGTGESCEPSAKVESKVTVNTPDKIMELLEQEETIELESPQVVQGLLETDP